MYFSWSVDAIQKILSYLQYTLKLLIFIEQVQKLQVTSP